MAPASGSRARWQATLTCLATLVLAWRLPGAFTFGLALVAVMLALMAWASPDRYAPVQRASDWLTRQLVAGVSWVVLGAVYFGVFVPLRLGRALIRRPALELQARPERTSYFTPLPPGATGRFDRQF